MRRFLKYAAIGLVVAATGLIVVAWVLFESRFFNSLRSEVLAKALSIQINRPVKIAGEVRVRLGLPIEILVSEVSIPSAEVPNVNLAELQSLTLLTDPTKLLQGTIDFDRLNVTGLTVRLLRTEDQQNTWSSHIEDDPSSHFRGGAGGISATPSTATYEVAANLANFVRLRSEAYTSVRVLFEDERTGFVFDFELEEMKFQQLDGAQRLLITSFGTVNGTAFTLSGDYPHVGPFETRAAFGGMNLTFDGSSDLSDEGRTVEGQLSFDAGEIGNVLDVLKLQRSIEGAATLDAIIRRAEGRLEIGDIEAEVAFINGRRITASGRIGDLAALHDMNIETQVQLFAEDEQPAPARRISDIRILGADATLVGEAGNVFIDDATVYTNGFEYEISEIGPIAIGRIRRTDEGLLALSDISIQAGPSDAPILVATGELGNLLQGEDFELGGTVSASARLLLSSLDNTSVQRFGGLEATFRLDDGVGYPRLSRLEARSVGTDIWTLNAHAESGIHENAKSINLDLALDIPDGAAFLSALGLREVDIAPIGLAFSADLDEHGLGGAFDVTAGRSRISTSLELKRAQGRLALDGSVSSDALFLADLKNAAAGLVEVSNFIDEDRDGGRQGAEAMIDVEVQPLVLPPTEEIWSDLLAKEGAQPLVLKPKETTLASLLAEEGVQPLVLQTKAPSLRDMLDVKTLLLETDIDIALNIDRLSGVQGVTSVTSALVASEGKARLGPIDVRYGGGFARAEASMDLANLPARLRISGSTGGWDIGRILEGTGQDIAASGVLEGSFDLTGNPNSARAFVNSMQGVLSLNLSRGEIATSLIELAGMGILPWLFSQERRQKYTRIDCLAAPLRFRAGKVLLGNTVLETHRVQLVARGELDWVRDAVSVSAEPRIIGKPLSRSPWPFTIAGRLSDPKFKLLVGGARARRADGASAMPSQRKPCIPDILQLQ